MATRAAGKVMTAPTIPQMTIMTSATRRRICAWVVTRRARPWSLFSRAWLTVVSSTTRTIPVPSQAKEATTASRREWVTMEAHLGVATSASRPAIQTWAAM